MGNAGTGNRSAALDYLYMSQWQCHQYVVRSTTQWQSNPSSFLTGEAESCPPMLLLLLDAGGGELAVLLPLPLSLIHI